MDDFNLIKRSDQVLKQLKIGDIVEAVHVDNSPASIPKLIAGEKYRVVETALGYSWVRIQTLSGIVLDTDFLAGRFERALEVHEYKPQVDSAYRAGLKAYSQFRVNAFNVGDLVVAFDISNQTQPNNIELNVVYVVTGKAGGDSLLLTKKDDKTNTPLYKFGYLAGRFIKYVPPEQYTFSAPKFIGKPYVLTNTTLDIKREGFSWPLLNTEQSWSAWFAAPVINIFNFLTMKKKQRVK